MQTEKSQPSGQWIMPKGEQIMPETRFTSFLALFVDHRAGISLSVLETDVWCDSRGHYVLPLSVTPLKQESVCNQLLPEFSSNQFENLHKCYEHIEDVHVTFCRRKNNFWQNDGIFEFKVSLQYRVASLCNQHLPGFSSYLFETLHRCWRCACDFWQVRK